VLVQAVKDPMKSKGARLTTEISLPGRFVVFVPHGEGLGVSRRVPDDERIRLKEIVKGLDVKKGGVIVRTAAEGASAEDIERDLVFLQKLWKTIEQQAKRAKAPALVYQEAELPLRIVRDLFHRRLRARGYRPRAHLQARRRLPEEDVAAHGRPRPALQGEDRGARGVRR
jgi:ribonuclease E